MKIKIGNEIYDSKKEPVMLIFDDDAEKDEVISHLSNMEKKDGVRKYLIYPNDKLSADEAKEFMKI